MSLRVWIHPPVGRPPACKDLLDTPAGTGLKASVDTLTTRIMFCSTMLTLQHHGEINDAVGNAVKKLFDAVPGDIADNAAAL